MLSDKQSLQRDQPRILVGSDVARLKLAVGPNRQQIAFARLHQATGERSQRRSCISVGTVDH